MTTCPSIKSLLEEPAVCSVYFSEVQNPWKKLKGFYRSVCSSEGSPSASKPEQIQLWCTGEARKRKMNSKMGRIPLGTTKKTVLPQIPFYGEENWTMAWNTSIFSFLSQSGIYATHPVLLRTHIHTAMQQGESRITHTVPAWYGRKCRDLPWLRLVNNSRHCVLECLLYMVALKSKYQTTPTWHSFESPAIHL